MAKTSKNKPKLWRRNAHKVNAEEGRKHRGRSAKITMQIPPIMSLLVAGMFVKVGLLNLKNPVEEVVNATV